FFPRRLESEAVDIVLRPDTRVPTAESELGVFLAEMINDRRGSGRVQAINLLRDLGIASPASHAALLRALQEAQGGVRKAAVEALHELDVPRELRPMFQKTEHAMAYLFGGLLAPFCIFHLLLFMFFPQVRSNLYYALFVGVALVR